MVDTKTPKKPAAAPTTVGEKPVLNAEQAAALALIIGNSKSAGSVAVPLREQLVDLGFLAEDAASPTLRGERFYRKLMADQPGRQRGNGEPCEKCQSRNTFFQSSRTEGAVRVAWWKCLDCCRRFKAAAEKPKEEPPKEK